MNLFFSLAFAICFASQGAAAPIDRNSNEKIRTAPVSSTIQNENFTAENQNLHRENSEVTTFERRIRSVVARRRTTSNVHEVTLKDSAKSYIEENEADLTKFENKDFEDLYRQLGYK